MLKQFKFLFFASFFIISLNCVSAGISVTPSSIPLWGTATIEIDLSHFNNYIWFYEKDSNKFLPFSIGLGCEQTCQEVKSFDFTFESYYFPVGSYKIAVFSTDSNEWVYAYFEIVGETCSDGTLSRECSIDKPYYCENGEFTNQCGSCGCPSGQICQEKGNCFNPPSIPIGENKKTDSLYSEKEVFLVSDSDWKTILPFVSVAVWTEKNEFCTPKICVLGICAPSICFPDLKVAVIEKNPFLIYHDEGNEVFDADSIIYFMQQYSPSKVTIIGDSPKKLDGLLVTSPELGVGLQQGNIQRISPNDYLSYWESFDKVVYVQDDYELALLVSTYASLINAPMIIEGTSNDLSEIFSGREVICVGNVVPSGSSCSETYNLDSLRQKYKAETNTDKVILVNPNDYSPYLLQYFFPDKSPYGISELYYKDSLIAPILASAKHELILSKKVTLNSDEMLMNNRYIIKEFIDPFLLGMNYLTIMASSYAIPDKITDNLFPDFKIALDSYYYADKDGNNKPDISVGRIGGISTSDVSSYIARDLFLGSLQKTGNVKLMGSSFFGTMYSMVVNLRYYFKDVGYNAIAIGSYEEAYFFNPYEWEDQDLIFYVDHGAAFWAGIYSWNIPSLKNSLVIADACDTISTSDSNSFWAYSIRKGAIGFVGAVSVSFLGTNYFEILNSVYYENHNLGEATRKNFLPDVYRRMTTLIGDPTYDVAPKYSLKEEIDVIRLVLCMPRHFVCLSSDNCCVGLACSLFTCKNCYNSGTNIYWPYWDWDMVRCCNSWDWVTREDPNFCCYFKKWNNFGCWWNAKHCGTHTVEDHKQCR
jgi:hypothetical protein